MLVTQKNLKSFLFLLTFGLIAWGGIKGTALAWFALQSHSSGSNKSVILEIPRGKTAGSISMELLEKGVISDASKFLKLGKLMGWWKEVKAGEYEVTSNDSPVELFSKLTSGVSVSLPFVVREGENIYQIADKLEERKPGERKKFLSLVKDPEFMRSLGLQDPLPPSLEGYLFPETYFFPRRIEAKEVIQKMFQQMDALWTEERHTKAQLLGMSQHEVLTLASMVEKETGAAHERPVIASVFHNRLKRRQRLESDPTTIYGIWENFNGNLKRSHLRQKTKYNTYSFRGLPLGPIANPGVKSIDAALSPAKTEYLYFVSRNDGTHIFTTNFKDHKKAVRDFQLNPKAREGKSWRDLHKKEGTN